jgi:hypothetical protein
VGPSTLELREPDPEFSIMAFETMFQFSKFCNNLLISRHRFPHGTNARTTKMLIWIARLEFNTVAAMIAPCSVKAKGR